MSYNDNFAYISSYDKFLVLKNAFNEGAYDECIVEKIINIEVGPFARSIKRKYSPIKSLE